jgi:hypothetical protein
LSTTGYENCDIRPWVQEIVNRMHETKVENKPYLDLSYGHPRGFIPNQIIRRRAVQEILKGWPVYSAKSAPTPETGKMWAGAIGQDWNTCDVRPFIKELDRREQEAAAEAYKLSATNCVKHFPVVDTTCFHPRGGIPEIILNRIKLRSNTKWRTEVSAEIHRLLGEANKAQGLAGTLLGKCDAVEDKRKLKAASKLQLELAEDLRAQADRLRKELDD